MSASADVRHRQVPYQLLFEAGLFNEIWLVMITLSLCFVRDDDFTNEHGVGSLIFVESNTASLSDSRVLHLLDLVSTYQDSNHENGMANKWP